MEGKDKKELKLLNKDEILDFDLWANYWNYLKSLEVAFRVELENKITTAKIHSSLNCETFSFEVEGQRESGSNHIGYDDISFYMENSDYYLKIVIPYGCTNKAYFFLDHEDDDPVFESANEIIKGVVILFSQEMIDVAVEWITKGRLTGFGKDNFK